MEDDEIEYYVEDKRKKNVDEYDNDDPWENYGEGFMDEEGDEHKYVGQD